MFLVSLFSVALVFSTMPGRIQAQTDTVESDTSVSVSVSDGTSSTASGEVVKASNTSGWGLWLRGIKERVSLLTTFDPVVKAEKALKFAEERSKIAEMLAGKTDDIKAQERLKKVLERTQKLEDQADHVKDKLLDNPDARAKMLLKNLLNFKEHKEEVFRKFEEKLTPDQLEKLKTVRTEAEDKSKALINALQNVNLPEDVRTHLEDVKAKIEEQREQVKEFRDEQKVLLDRIKSGDESAKEELKTLRDDRKEEIKTNVKTRIENRNTSSTKPIIKPLLKQEIRQEIRKEENRLNKRPEERKESIKRELEEKNILRARQELKQQ